MWYLCFTIHYFLFYEKADSGSPLIDLILGTLIGIVSTGVGCGKANLPGIYTRVSDFNDFISNNVSGWGFYILGQTLICDI